MKDSHQKGLYQVLNTLVSAEGQDLLKAVLFLLMPKDGQQQLIDFDEVASLLKRSGKASDTQIKKLRETYNEIVNQKHSGVGSATHNFVPGSGATADKPSGLKSDPNSLTP